MQIKRLGTGDINLINEFARTHQASGGAIRQAMSMLGSGNVVGVFASGDRSKLVGIIVDDGSSVTPISDVDISNAVAFLKKSHGGEQRPHTSPSRVGAQQRVPRQQVPSAQQGSRNPSSTGAQQPMRPNQSRTGAQQPVNQQQTNAQRRPPQPSSTGMQRHVQQSPVPQPQQPHRTGVQVPIGRTDAQYPVKPARTGAQQPVGNPARTGMQPPINKQRTGAQPPANVQQQQNAANHPANSSASQHQPNAASRTGMQRPIVSADPSRTGTHRPIGDTGLAQRADAPRRGMAGSQKPVGNVPHQKASSVNGVSTNPYDVTPMRPTVGGAQTPKKSHKLRNGIIAGVIALGLIGGIGAAYLNRSSIALFIQSVIPSNENTEDEHHWQIGENESAEMTISTGDTVVEVRKMLYDLGFASTADVLYEKLDEQNKMNSLQAGTYTLIGSETPDEIINRLTSGIKSPDGYIGINVGDTMDIIYTKFDGDEMPFGADDMEKADDPSLYKDDYPMMAAIPDEVTTIEGFIPAGVYDCHEAETAEDAMRIMLDAGQSRFEASGLDAETFYEYLTIGSMIDKEVFFDDEKPLVASVIYNRLDQHMKLGIDATVKYATGSTDARVTDAMTETDSPYNTYQVDGLPIGPICSGVSDSAFAAAQNPAKTDYIYYVLKDKEGHHAFSSDYQQFEKDKDAYLELFGYTDNVAADEENTSNNSGE